MGSFPGSTVARNRYGLPGLLSTTNLFRPLEPVISPCISGGTIGGHQPRGTRPNIEPGLRHPETFQKQSKGLKRLEGYVPTFGLCQPWKNPRAIDRLILGKLGNRFLSSWSFDLTWEYLMEQPYGDVY